MSTVKSSYSSIFGRCPNLCASSSASGCSLNVSFSSVKSSSVGLSMSSQRKTPSSSRDWTPFGSTFGSTVPCASIRWLAKAQPRVLRWPDSLRSRLGVFVGLPSLFGETLALDGRCHHDVACPVTQGVGDATDGECVVDHPECSLVHGVVELRQSGGLLGGFRLVLLLLLEGPHGQEPTRCARAAPRTRRAACAGTCRPA